MNQIMTPFCNKLREFYRIVERNICLTHIFVIYSLLFLHLMASPEFHIYYINTSHSPSLRTGYYDIPSPSKHSPYLTYPILTPVLTLLTLTTPKILNNNESELPNCTTSDDIGKS